MNRLKYYYFLKINEKIIFLNEKEILEKFELKFENK